MLSKLIGIVVTWFLIIGTLGTANIQAFCKNGRKINCESVLHSKFAKLLPWLSLSEIGFIYFFGSLLSLFFSVLLGETTILSLLAFISIASLPIIIFSIYYQGWVLKQWCTLCVAVQLILFFELTFGIVITINGLSEITIHSLLITLFCFGFISFLWFSFKPFYVKSTENTLLKRKLGRFQRNKTVFNSLLSANTTYTDLSSEYVLAANLPSTKKVAITLVTKPNCKPCRKAHAEIDKLIHQFGENVQFQLVFISPDKISKHIHLLFHENKEAAYKALYDWYSNTYKNVKEWQNEFPLLNSLNKEIELRIEKKLIYQQNWCIENRINSTPTILFNNQEIPQEYSLKDVSYLLKNYFT